MTSPSKVNLTDRFVDLIHSIGQRPLSESVTHHARRCLLDYLGATIAGACLTGTKASLLLNLLGGSDTSLNVIGMNRKSGLLAAAFVNGISSHQAELDDGVISGIIHPGAPVFSALIPYAQSKNIGGELLLSAIVCGYEASVRIANTIQPSHKRRGYHATGTCGAIGGAMALALLSGCDKATMKNAFSAACTSASGSLKVLEDNSQLKPYNPGQAALTALLAHSMAESGFQGPDDALSGPAGFLTMMSDEPATDFLFNQTARFAIESVYLKPYAACRYCHPAIEAAIAIRADPTFRVEAAKKIIVSTYDLAVTHHDHTAVESISSARMSIPYSVAVALATGKAGLEEYSDELIGSPTVKELMKKISVRADDRFSALFPQQTAARVEAEMNDNSVRQMEVFNPKGDPSNPLTDQEVMNKFLALAKFAQVDDQRATKILEVVWRLPRDTTELYELL